MAYETIVFAWVCGIVVAPIGFSIFVISRRKHAIQYSLRAMITFVIVCAIALGIIFAFLYGQAEYQKGAKPSFLMALLPFMVILIWIVAGVLSRIVNVPGDTEIAATDVVYGTFRALGAATLMVISLITMTLVVSQIINV